MNKILIIQTRPGIGDTVLFLSAIHQIAKYNQKSKIYLVTKDRSKAKSLLKDDEYIKNILYVKNRNGRHIRDKLLKYFDLWDLLKHIKFQNISSMQGKKRMTTFMKTKLSKSNCKPNRYIMKHKR